MVTEDSDWALVKERKHSLATAIISEPAEPVRLVLNDLMPKAKWAGLVLTLNNSTGVVEVVNSPEPEVWFWERLNCECKNKINKEMNK